MLSERYLNPETGCSLQSPTHDKVSVMLNKELSVTSLSTVVILYLKREVNRQWTHQQSVVIPDENADDSQQTQDDGEERFLHGCRGGRGRQPLAVLQAG